MKNSPFFNNLFPVFSHKKQEMQKKVTPLNEVLAQIDEMFLPTGKRNIFSIGFYNSEGEYVFFHRAAKVGLKQDQKKGDFKGVQQLNEKQEFIGHPYPVYIHCIHEFNGKHIYK